MVSCGRSSSRDKSEWTHCGGACQSAEDGEVVVWCGAGWCEMCGVGLRGWCGMVRVWCGVVRGWCRMVRGWGWGDENGEGMFLGSSV